MLDYIDAKNRPVRLKDITTDLLYPPSSASGVLKSLVVLGFLNYDRDTLSYTLTPRVTTLGSRLNDALWQDRRVMLALEQLVSMTGVMVGLGVQSDIYAQYITVLPPPSPVPYQLRPGAIRPVTRCGIGWALLSQREDAEVERLRRRVNAKEEDRTLHVSAATLGGQIATVRRLGYAFSRHTWQPGVGIIAMALPRPIGGRWCAIGAAGDVPSLDAAEASIAGHLRAVTQGLDIP